MDSDITGWFTTDEGNHIPIHGAQSKVDAMRQFRNEHFIAEQERKSRHAAPYDPKHRADGLTDYDSLSENRKRNFDRSKVHVEGGQKGYQTIYGWVSLGEDDEQQAQSPHRVWNEEKQAWGFWTEKNGEPYFFEEL